MVVELNSKLGLSFNSNHVRYRVKLWKKHHTIINDIRSTTKFNWDDKSKMLVITVVNYRIGSSIVSLRKIQMLKHIKTSQLRIGTTSICWLGRIGKMVRMQNK